MKKVWQNYFVLKLATSKFKFKGGLAKLLRFEACRFKNLTRAAWLSDDNANTNTNTNTTTNNNHNNNNNTVDTLFCFGSAMSYSGGWQWGWSHGDWSSRGPWRANSSWYQQSWNENQWQWRDRGQSGGGTTDWHEDWAQQQSGGTHDQEERDKDDPADTRYVYAVVPFSLKADLPQGDHYREIRQEIEDMGCTIKVKSASGQGSESRHKPKARVVVTGPMADSAFQVFMDRVNAISVRQIRWDKSKVSHINCEADLQAELHADPGGTGSSEMKKQKRRDHRNPDLNPMGVDYGDTDSSEDETASASATTKMQVEKEEDDDPPPPPAGAPPLPTCVGSGVGVVAGTVSLEEAPELPGLGGQRQLISLATRLANHAKKFLGMAPEAEDMILNFRTSPLESEALGAMKCRVSFCVSCFRREWQLLPALAMNMAVCEKAMNAGYVRFVVYMAVRTDDQEKFNDACVYLRENYSDQLASGALVVALGAATAFHSSKFKNAAHRLAVLTPWGQGLTSNMEHGIEPQQELQWPADGGTSAASSATEAVVKQESADGGTSAAFSSTGKIVKQESTGAGVAVKQEMGSDGGTSLAPTHLLINLDADNILSADFLRDFIVEESRVQECLSGRHIWGFRCSLGGDSGVTGRVALSQEAWLAVGGYNEEFYPTGYQDIDLFTRVSKAGTAFILNKKRCGWSIPNTLKTSKGSKTKAKTEFCGSSVPWTSQNQENIVKSKQNLSKGIWWANSETRLDVESPVAVKQFLEKVGCVNPDLPDKGKYPARLGGKPPPRLKPREFSSRDSDKVVPVTVPAAAKTEPVPKKRALPFAEVECTAFKIEIVTLGVANLTFTLPNICSRQALSARSRDWLRQMRQTTTARSGERAVEEDELVKVLYESGAVAERRWYLVFDMRNAHDPEMDDSLREHVGTHPTILDQLSKTTVFQEMVLQVRKSVREMMDEGPAPQGSAPTILVVVFCKKGCHRGPGAGHLLHVAITSKVEKNDDLGASSRDPRSCTCLGSSLLHISQAAGEWAHPRKCGPCPKCTAKTKDELSQTSWLQKTNAELRAKRLWQLGKA